MCIVLFDWQPDSATPLRMAANRDEFHARPAEPARWRGDIFCGLDLTAGGTWLGIHRNGSVAVVTNYREPTPADKAANAPGACCPWPSWKAASRRNSSAGNWPNNSTTTAPSTCW